MLSLEHGDATSPIRMPGWTARLLLGGLLLGLLMLGLTILKPGSALAAQNFPNCDYANAHFATLLSLDHGSDTYNFPAGCTINLSGSLKINGGAGITLNGHGLILNGNGSADVVTFDDATSPAALTLNNVTVQNGGAGIHDSASVATVSLNDSNVINNHGIGIDAGLVTLTNSTVGGNTGDGIDYHDASTIEVTNGTISGNGGTGINAPNASVDLTSTTISGNGADGVKATALQTVASIFANTGTNCAVSSLTDEGYNLSSDGTCVSTGTGSKTVSAGDLHLEGLASNGGPAETAALDSDSVAIDAIPLTDQGQCSAGATTDARGTARPQGLGCDAGAFEVAQPNVSFPSCPTQPELQAVLNSAPGDGTAYTFTLPSGGCALDLSGSLTIVPGSNSTIQGNGLTLTGNQNDDDITIDDGTGSPTTLTLKQVTVAYGGRYGIRENGSVATVELIQSTVTHNQSGISAHHVSLINSTVSDNPSSDGVYSDSTVAVDSTITNNGRYGVLGIDVNLTATIVANNDSGACSIARSFSDGGYNLATDDSCQFTAGTSKVTTAGALNLLPLGSYGGPTETVALGPGSVAIDAVPSATCQNLFSTDQRGILRPQPASGGCDAGAYEAPSLTLSANANPTGNQGWYTLAPKLSFSYSGLAPGQQVVCLNANDASASVILATARPGKLNQTDSGSGTLKQQGIYTCGISQDDTMLGVSSASQLGYKVDPSAPTLGLCTTTPAIRSSGGWYSQNVTFSCPVSDIGSGIVVGAASGPSATVSGSTNVAAGSLNAKAMLVNITLCLPDDGGCFGISLTSYQICDVAGNCDNIKPIFDNTYQVDLTTPSFTCDSGSSSSWTDQNVTVNCDATIDSLSSSFTLSTNVSPGSANAQASTGDKQLCNQANSCVTAGPYTFAVDLENPTIKADARLADGTSYTPGSWTNQRVTVALTAADDDGSGVQAISYNLDGLSNTIGGKPSYSVTVSGDGTHTLSFSATDRVGHSSGSQTITIKIDTTKPEIQISSPTNQASYFAGQNVVAGFSCDDSGGSGLVPGNGCAGTLDGQPIENGAAIETSSGAVGSHTLTVVATDQAGNTNTQSVSYGVVSIGTPALKVNGTAPNNSLGYWYNLINSPDGVTLTVSDTDSIVSGYRCTDNGTTLSLHLSGATPPTGSASLSDGAHHLSCVATVGAGTSTAVTATVRVDRTAPKIELTTPASEASYIQGQTVDARYSCEDATSEIAPTSCRGTVPNGSPIDTSEPGSYRFTVTATDNAGNSASTAISYVVDYHDVELRGSTATVNRGFYAIFRIAPEDFQGQDEASRNLRASSVELDGPDGKAIAFAHQFQFGRFDGKEGYQLTVNTRNLTSGTWKLMVRIGGDPTLYAIDFVVK